MYVRDLIIEKSYEIGELMKLYTHMSEKYNTLLHLKNITIIGILFPLEKKYMI